MKMATNQPYSLWTNNRFWLLVTSVLIAITTAVSVWSLVPSGDLRIIRTEQTYGLIGIIFLYAALLATPLTKLFPNMKGKSEYLHVRRAIGVSAFFFSLLHASLAFIGQLGGINGIGFLTSRYNLALILGLIALIILMAMAVTSFDIVIEKMGFPRWKKLHRLIYVASVALMIHIVMLGTHFAYGSSLIAQITLGAVLFLLGLEAIRSDRWFRKRFPRLQNYGVASMVVLSFVVLAAGFSIGKNNRVEPANVRAHGGHGTGGHATAAEPYAAFKNTATIEGRTITIDKQQISFDTLIAGGEVINFMDTPAFTTTKSPECFLVNQESYEYYQGLIKVSGPVIECLPIGDVKPPEPGIYTLYLRFDQAAGAVTLPFNLEITL